VTPSFSQSRRALAGWLVCLLLGCTVERDAPFSGHDAIAPTLVAQRVTATVRREAATLVRIETDGEIFVTTPEHPFATPEVGWIPAGRLAPGDPVVSARFGTARVVSARSKTRPRPVPVFNLTVARSHAYLVGRDQVLVHNTRCKDTQALLNERTEELNQAQRKLDALIASGASSSQRKPEDSAKISELQERIRKIGKSRSRALASLKKAGIDPDPNAVDPITRKIRELEKLDREIAKLQSELPSSSDKAETERRIDKLFTERQAVMKSLSGLRGTKRKRTGEEPPDYVPVVQLAPRPVVKRVRTTDVAKDARLLQHAETEYEAAKKTLEATRKELRELETRRPGTEHERKAAETRKSELEKLLPLQERDYEAANRILNWEKEVAKINETQATGGKRPELVARRKELRADISAERTRRNVRRSDRKKIGDSNYNEMKRTEKRRLPETLERMKEELSELREQPDSPSRAERITHLENAIETATQLIEVRRKIKNGEMALVRARKKHNERIKHGEDTSDIVPTIAQLEHDLGLRRAERTRLRAQALLLGLVQAQRRNELDDQDAAFVQEIESMLADPATMDERRLTEIARATADTIRGEADALDEAFFDEIWGGGRHDGAPDGAPQETAPNDVESLDEELQAILASLMEPDPEAVPEPGSPVQRTEPPRNPDETGPSNDPPERDTQLRMEWKRRIEERLKDARDQLQIMQSIDRYRNESIEADLLREIAVLEQHLQNPPF
jgi:chromosome segregation ATPase